MSASGRRLACVRNRLFSYYTALDHARSFAFTAIKSRTESDSFARFKQMSVYTITAVVRARWVLRSGEHQERVRLLLSFFQGCKKTRRYLDVANLIGFGRESPFCFCCNADLSDGVVDVGPSECCYFLRSGSCAEERFKQRFLIFIRSCKKTCSVQPAFSLSPSPSFAPIQVEVPTAFVARRLSADQHELGIRSAVFLTTGTDCHRPFTLRYCVRFT